MWYLVGPNSRSMEDCGAESELNLRGGMAQEVSGKKILICGLDFILKIFGRRN